jgi:hypothetical protein
VTGTLLPGVISKDLAPARQRQFAVHCLPLILGVCQQSLRGGRRLWSGIGSRRTSTPGAAAKPADPANGR